MGKPQVSVDGAAAPREQEMGVETEEQRAFLSAHSCEEIQGYLIAGPMPERGFRDLLAGEPRAAERLS